MGIGNANYGQPRPRKCGPLKKIIQNLMQQSGHHHFEVSVFWLLYAHDHLRGLSHDAETHRLVLGHEDVDLIDDEERHGFLGDLTAGPRPSLLPADKHPLQVGQSPEWQ